MVLAKMEVTSPFPVNKNQMTDSLVGDQISVISMIVDNKENNPGEVNARSESEELYQSQNYRTPRVEDDTTRSAMFLSMSSTFNSEIFNKSKRSCDVSVQTNFTLSSRESFEPDDLLKSYCVEIFNDKSIIIPSSSNFSYGSDTPPSRSIKQSRLLFKKDTPASIGGRKLSLRSKTMICSALGKSRPRPKVFQRHKSLEEKKLISNTFSLIPHQETPTSNSDIILVNPFEADLTERLGKTIFSPDVFANVLSPSEDSEFLRWTIEDISSINPVPIEEDAKLPSEDENPEKESIAQQEIDRYFSETHLVLSPYDSPPLAKDTHHNSVINAAASTPKECNKKLGVDVLNNFTQTVLTLPENLSDILEESLLTYFKIYKADDISLNASNLRRKLFFHSEDDPPSPVRFEKDSSPLVATPWKMDSSPLTAHGRFHTPMLHQHQMSSPEISPVFQSPAVKSKNESLTCKKTLHLYFQGDKSAPAGGRGPEGNSQDTGYHTGDSSRQSASPAASTPTRPRRSPMETVSPVEN